MGARLTIKFELSGFEGSLEVENQDAAMLVRQTGDLIRQLRNFGAKPIYREVNNERASGNLCESER